MRLSNFLVMFSACALFAACANDETPDGNNLSQGNGEQAFIAVRLAAPNAMTRAFQDGDDNLKESDIQSARFYFFDNGGNAVTVSGNVNYVSPTGLNFTDNSNNSENIDETSDAILVLSDVDLATPPTKMAVVLNPPSDLGTNSKSLSQLSAAADDYATTVTGSGTDAKGNFVMSNSVYIDNNTKVDAVDIAAYITESSEAATNNPVTVYVERVLARVDVKQKTGGSGLNGYSDDTGVAASEIQGQQEPGTKQVKAVVKGWGLANQNSTSYLIKQLDNTWNATSPFTGWNDATKHRSYWAKTTDINSRLATNPTYEGLLPAEDAQVPTTQYCQERTGIENINGNPTELLVIAELQVDDQAVTIARYAGRYYTVDALLDQFLTMTGDIYIKSKSGGSGTTTIDSWTALNKDHLKLRPAEDGESVAAYEAVLDLQDNFAVDADYEFASDNQGSNSMTLTDVESKLNAFTAQLWYNGRTYYHVPITHDTDGATATDPGRFGVVRNHLYNIAISGITGLGTPIPGDTNGDEDDPDDEEDPGKDPIDPEDPEDNNSYLAAEINILSWNVIGQEVELGGKTE